MPETIVLALSGLSPAVITETVYNLLKEDGDLLPLRVVPITTNTGAQKIAEMNQQGVWQDLCEKLAISPNDLTLEQPRIICDRDGQAIEDTDTKQNHDLTCDFMAEIVQEYKKAGHSIIASISGGRKTMGALMYAVMSMLGDMQDRITHVLVDNSILGFADFYFPSQTKQQLEDRSGNTLQAGEVEVNLIDIPFPRFKLINKKPFISDKMSFTDLVQSVNTPDWKELKITLDIHARQVSINDKIIDFSKLSYPFQLITYLLICNKMGIPMLSYRQLERSHKINTKNLHLLHKFIMEIPLEFVKNITMDPPTLFECDKYGDISKAKNLLKKHLNNSGAQAAYIAGLFGKDINSFKIPADCIDIPLSQQQKKTLKTSWLTISRDFLMSEE